MFTGIVQAIGTIAELKQTPVEWHLRIHAGKLPLADVRIGDSIAVSGCCLTVVELEDNGFRADVSQETMRCTTLGMLEKGANVNLEKAMPADGRFGGHLVSGHIDGVGELVRQVPEGKGVKLEFSAPENLARYIAAKGSISIDGVSLTVNTVQGNLFTINVIPHTQDETVIGLYQRGQKVNLETDLIARYLERLLETHPAGTISREFLQEHGYQVN